MSFIINTFIYALVWGILSLVLKRLGFWLQSTGLFQRPDKSRVQYLLRQTTDSERTVSFHQP